MISVNINDYKFNFRVACIVLNKKEDCILMNTRKGMGYWVLPGGRVEEGEDTITALQREYKEELGVELDNPQLKIVLENFFNFDNKKYHELQYFYYSKFLNNKFENEKEIFNGLEIDKDQFKWIAIKDLDNIKYMPSCVIPIIKDFLVNKNKNIVHIINKKNG
jgi:ADP-ribose pyrophosphatase YjhB (NUDIX family)